MPNNRKTVTSMTKFPLKLWLLLETSHSSDIGIKWSADGQKVHLDGAKFAQYLGSSQNVFSTEKFPSFLRQLNLYGFRKEKLTERCLNCGHNGLHQNGFYAHPLFKKNAPELVDQMERKIKNPSKRNVVKRNRKERENIEKILEDTLKQEILLYRIGTPSNEGQETNMTVDELRVLVEIIQQDDSSLSEAGFA